MKRLILIAAVAAFTLCARDQGFQGKWQIDKGASTATADIPDGLTQQIKKKGDNYQIETVWREPGNGIVPLAFLGVMATQMKLSTDGQDAINEIGPFKQWSKTRENGNQLVTDWTAVVNGQNVKGQWTRTLAADGKTMTLDIQESTDDGKSNSGKLVFKRK